MKSLFDQNEFKRRRAARKALSPEQSTAQPGTLTVSALAGMLDQALRRAMPAPVRVIGEVSGFRERTHWYFDLKDAEAVVGCVMFQSAAKRAGFTPANGQEVVVTGRVEFYAKQGRVSFIVEKIEQVGAGALELAYRKLCEEIRALGWFDPARKRPPPAFPRKIGVVTSRSAAALQDVLVTMKRRCAAVGVVLADVRVQGDGAAGEIAGAVRELSRRHRELGIDALIVTRGGGSMEDLWAFNERIVAQAIVECEIPVVAAIGHETDTTIAELVADERCATPTQAAMRLTPDCAALFRELDSAARRLEMVVGRALEEPRHRIEGGAGRLPGAAGHLQRRAEARLERAATRLERSRPQAVYDRLIARLREAGVRLHAGARRALELPDLDAVSLRMRRGATLAVRERAAHLDALDRQLRAVGPLSVLERGFSVTARADGRIVRAPGDVRAGDSLTTRVAEGSIESRVQGPPARARPAHPEAPTQSPSPAQLGLFGAGQEEPG